MIRMLLIWASLILWPLALTHAAPGDLDSNFGNGGKVITPIGAGIDWASSVAIQSDGKIVASGYSENGADDSDFALARYNTDGSLDAGFGAGGLVITPIGPSHDVPLSVAIQSDGKIVAAGFSCYTFVKVCEDNGGLNIALTRYNADGSLDAGFGSGGIVITPLGADDSQVYAVAIQTDARIVVAGSSIDRVRLISRFALARYNVDGSLDTGFGSGGIVVTDMGTGFADALSVAIQSDGKIVAAGYRGDSTGHLNDFVLARYKANGSLDTGFGSGGVVVTDIGTDRDIAHSVAIQSDGKIVAAGRNYNGNFDYDFAIARYNADGSLDTGFGSSGIVVTDMGTGVDFLRSVAIQPNGKIVVAGDCGPSPTVGYDFALVRYNTNGSLDTTFGGGDGISSADFNNSEDRAYGMVLDTNGRAVLVGSSHVGGSNVDWAIARFLLASPRASYDFDGDGRADISVFRPSEADWYLLRSRDGFTAANFGLATDKIAPADFDGDGKTDVAVYRPSQATWYWLNSSTGTLSAVQFGSAEDLPTPADYDGDGRADTSVFRPSNGVWYRLNSSNGSFFAVQFGASEDKPTIGDYDGDGHADIAVFRPSTGAWYRLNSSNGQFIGISFGFSTDLITPADFDGDAKTDVAVYRPSAGTWFWLNSTNGGLSAVPFGTSEDVPVAADFDGDGRADVSVFRPSNGVWYRLNSGNGSFFAVQFGTSTDRPTPAAFRY